MKAIYERDAVNFVEYNNADDAQIMSERFHLTKKFLGITVFRKRFRQDSNLWEEKALKKTGFR